MIEDWEGKVFKDGAIPYWLVGCTLIGGDVRIEDGVYNDSHTVKGDAVIFNRKDDNAEVAMAICSDGTWIRGVGRVG
jgi:hypothetical protein